jgi:RNA polymerase sigma-70 factor (ECF subfamily)
MPGTLGEGVHERKQGARTLDPGTQRAFDGLENHPWGRSRQRVEMGTGADEPRTDEDLLREVSAGDRGALRLLYERHAPWLTLRLARRCADPGLVEEVIQDTFVAVWKGAKRYRGQGEVGAWIWGIGIRRLIDRLRRRPAPMPVAAAGRDVMTSAEEQVLLGVEFGDLGTALNRLSPELRAVMQATVLDGLTTKEAARLLGIPQGTVKTRLMRARAELREVLA